VSSNGYWATVKMCSWGMGIGILSIELNHNLKERVPKGGGGMSGGGGGGGWGGGFH